jgi:hypothetical protein
MTTGGFSGSGGEHAFLASNYGADTPAEWNSPFDFEPFGIELAETDVLVGDIHLPVPVVVGLGPRFGFVDGPAGRAIEEQRLRLGRGFGDPSNWRVRAK